MMGGVMNLLEPQLSLEPNSNDIFFRCVEDSNEAIMISDHTGHLLYVNPAWTRIYGFSKEEALQTTPKILHSGYHSPQFYQDMWNQIQDPSIGFWKGEIINRAKDGTVIPVMLSITPFKSSQSGKILGFMGIALDISHRKELEAKVIQQDRLASVGLLASGLAHEIGTPLGVIRGRAEFLMMQAQDPSSAKYLGVIVSQIDRISKLIRSLLRISRSNSDAQMEKIHALTVVHEVIALVGEKLRSEKSEIHINIPEDLHVYADFHRMEQILLNLVMNSIHAIQKAIQDGRTENHALTISAENRTTKIAIIVKDTGCGISQENMKKLFKPFFTTKAVGEGTGLGLAIVSQLVHEIGGEISVESALHEGTTFTLLLSPVAGHLS